MITETRDVTPGVVANVLHRAAEIIGHKGWMRGSWGGLTPYGAELGCQCLATAVVMASAERWPAPGDLASEEAHQRALDNRAATVYQAGLAVAAGLGLPRIVEPDRVWQPIIRENDRRSLEDGPQWSVAALETAAGHIA